MANPNLNKLATPHDFYKLVGQQPDFSFNENQSSPTKVEVKFPPFWPNDVQLWFKASENLFNLKGIVSEKDKFALLFASLSINQLRKLQTYSADLDFRNSYAELKEALLKIYLPNRDKDLSELLYHTELGDKKPSELLAHMRKLLGGANSPTILRKLFVDRLPPETRRMLALIDTDNLDMLALRADRIFEEDLNITRYQNSFQSSGFSRDFENRNVAFSTPRSNDNIVDNSQFKPRARRSLFNESNFKTSPQTKVADKQLCWYHDKYGVKAVKCVGLCNFEKNQHDSSPHSKRFKAESNNVNSNAEPPCRLPKIFDPLTKTSYLIDTGSAISLVPVNDEFVHESDEIVLTAVNGSKINVFNVKELTVNFGMSRNFKWQFREAKIPFAIIGNDFLQHFDFKIKYQNGDIVLELPNAQAQKNLVNSLTGYPTSCQTRDNKPLNQSKFLSQAQNTRCITSNEFKPPLKNARENIQRSAVPTSERITTELKDLKRDCDVNNRECHVSTSCSDTTSDNDRICELLNSFPELTDDSLIGKSKPNHTKFHIKTRGSPVYQRDRKSVV